MDTARLNRWEKKNQVRKMPMITFEIVTVPSTDIYRK